MLTLVIVVACLVTALFTRRRLLSGHGGVFDCGLRTGSGNWMMGLARYEDECLAWYRVFSLASRAQLRFSRSRTHVLGHRNLDELEALALFADDAVIGLSTCLADDTLQSFELSMSLASQTGLMSWLEAAPPGGASYR